eukprot:gene25486-biopygen10642
MNLCHEGHERERNRAGIEAVDPLSTGYAYPGDAARYQSDKTMCKVR